MTTVSGRQCSFDILQKVIRDDSYSNLALDSMLGSSGLSARDASLATALVYGVIERRRTLDYQLALRLSKPLKKLKPQVYIILLIGAYQILYMDKIPVSAAVNESVKLAAFNGCTYAKGLINAVLRKVAENGICLPERDSPDYNGVRYSCEDWICEVWRDSYGEENAEALLENSFASDEVAVRVNTLKTTAEELAEMLASECFTVEVCSTVPDALIVRGGGVLHRSRCFEKGLFHIQDISSQLCCSALDAAEGDTVFDMCAAPGGKSLTLAQMMNNTGRVCSFDIYENRLGLISSAAQRLGAANIVTGVNDGSVLNKSLPKADKILCDVPCSGLGILRKKPEIRYKKKAEVDKLPDLQYSILCISSTYLKPGGTLVYSTCSLNPAENENVVSRFLDQNKDFEAVKALPGLKRPCGDTDFISLMPHIHGCDGFFIAKFRRKSRGV